MAAVVDARAVDGEQDLAAVEAVDEAGEGGAVGRGHRLQQEVGFGAEAGVLRGEEEGRLDLGSPGPPGEAAGWPRRLDVDAGFFHHIHSSHPTAN